MIGQNNHFAHYAPEKIPYAIERYVKETNRLYGVLDRQLGGRDFIAGEYSIADMASYPWIVSHERQGQTISHFPNLQRWFERVKARRAVARAYAKGEGLRNEGMTEEARKVLFGQTAASVKAI